MTEPPMIFRKTPRTLPDGCIHCRMSRTYCDAIRAAQDVGGCCQTCADSARDSH